MSDSNQDSETNAVLVEPGIEMVTTERKIQCFLSGAYDSLKFQGFTWVGPELAVGRTLKGASRSY